MRHIFYWILDRRWWYEKRLYYRRPNQNCRRTFKDSLAMVVVSFSIVVILF